MSDDRYYPVERNFKYHAPQKDQIPRYQDIRNHGLNMARYITESCPRSPERDQALQHLEEAVMWANAAIARNEKDETEVIRFEIKELRAYIGYISSMETMK